MMLKPLFLALVLAPSAAVLANSASAASMATVVGFGCCAAATSKKPLENAMTPSGPTGTIVKYLLYLKCRLTPIASMLIVILLACMMTGIAGATMLVA